MPYACRFDCTPTATVNSPHWPDTTARTYPGRPPALSPRFPAVPVCSPSRFLYTSGQDTAYSLPPFFAVLVPRHSVTEILPRAPGTFLSRYTRTVNVPRTTWLLFFMLIHNTPLQVRHRVPSSQPNYPAASIFPGYRRALPSRVCRQRPVHGASAFQLAFPTRPSTIR